MFHEKKKCYSRVKVGEALLSEEITVHSLNGRVSVVATDVRSHLVIILNVLTPLRRL